MKMVGGRRQQVEPNNATQQCGVQVRTENRNKQKTAKRTERKRKNQKINQTLGTERKPTRHANAVRIHPHKNRSGKPQRCRQLQSIQTVIRNQPSAGEPNRVTECVEDPGQVHVGPGNNGDRMGGENRIQWYSGGLTQAWGPGW